jgi:FKBP-type peptidyl-prolyl cis-trans isomerase FkpA
MAEAATATSTKGGRSLGLVLAFLLLIGAGIALAWVGAGSLRPQVSDSGLKFRTIKAGKGPTIVESDAALLDYILTVDDGTVMDSSESHGGAQPFTMKQVYPGFAEAMSKMQEGGEYRFTMPQSLAFVDGTPPGFPKDSNLTFDVRVRKIVPGGAAMLAAQQQQQAQQQGQAPTDQAPADQAPSDQPPPGQ